MRPLNYTTCPIKNTEPSMMSPHLFYITRDHTGILSTPYWGMQTETGAHPTYPTEGYPKENRH